MRIKAIIKLIDIKTLVAGAIPVVLGTMYTWYTYEKFNLAYFWLLLIAMLLIQSATNMINDYYDYKRGSDTVEKLGEKVLVSGEISPKQVLFLIILFEIIALIIGIYFANKTHYIILLIGIIGVAISILYTVGPLPISYTPFGEIVSGITMGIGITTTVIYIHSGIFSLNTLLVALPTTIYIGTILLSNNLCDIEPDRAAGRSTLPVKVGVKKTEKLWTTNIILLLIIALLLYLIDVYPIWVLITILLLFPYKNIKTFLSLDKNVHSKGRVMSLIGIIGIRYHLGIFIGLTVSIIINGSGGA